VIDRSYALISNLVVLALLVVGLLLLAERAGGARYLVVARVPVSGLAKRATVTLRGVEVGSVESIRLSRDDPRVVLVRIRVGEGTPITKGTYATLDRALVTGRASLVLDDDGDDPTPLSSIGDALGRIPLRASWMQKLQASLPSTVREARQLLARLSTALDDETVAQLRSALRDVAGFAKGLPALSKEARRALAGAPRLGSKAGKTLRGIESFVKKLEDVASSLGDAGRSVASLGDVGAGAAKRLSRRTLPKVDKLLTKLTSTVRSVRRLARQLRRDPQRLLRGRARRAPGPGERE